MHGKSLKRLNKGMALWVTVVLFTIPPACASTQNSPFLHQDVAAAHNLSPGMSKEQVKSVMGTPAKSEFDRGVEEWHYCSTGDLVDEFVAIFFHDGNVVATRNYSVTNQDAGGALGSCENFVKMGNYREPDRVTEIRVRG